MTDRWLLYGAYGHTGRLIAEEAVRRGHRPILAGRDEAKLRPLAERLGLEHFAVPLDDAPALRELVSKAKLVFNAAGPFVETSAAMVSACLQARAHYVDITGEVPVFESIFRRDAEALEAGIALMPGVGFDVVPSDCAARYVSDLVPGATELEIAFAVDGATSGGSAATAIESFSAGIQVRRDGQLTLQAPGVGARRQELGGRRRTVVPMTWGDLVTAQQTTGISNITVYMATSPGVPWLMRAVIPLGQFLFRFSTLRHLMRRLVRRLLGSPKDDETARISVWARARNPKGQQAEVHLSSIGSYPFTASSGVLAVERLLAGSFRGALTPASAFGADFVLEVPGTKRHGSTSAETVRPDEPFKAWVSG